ncbi:hypothetical protein FJZ39_03190 [Candidatus Saccharibacteria bacterium]|nr:hypothetical protein [Candidatus Saccharibacteria bacterium]
MRCFDHSKRTPIQQKNAGFTIVEIAVIAPIMIAAVVTIIAAIITMTTSTLSSRTESQLLHTTRQAIDTATQDIRLSASFMTEIPFNLSTPFGRDDNTASFVDSPAESSNDTLILASFQTDQNPLEPTRQLVLQPGAGVACANATFSNSQALQYYTIYFVKESTLWRRIIKSNETGCTPSWQRSTCSPGRQNGTSCVTQDQLVADNVQAFRVAYFATANSTTAINSTNSAGVNATTARITLELAQNVNGTTLTEQQVYYATRFEQ